MKTKSIDNSQDIIDSRDIMERIDELEELDDDDDKNELEALNDLSEQAEEYGEDWEYGSILIRDSYFEEYAQELALDCGMVTDNDCWPCTHIDWEAAAKELRKDCTSVKFGDITYWIR